MLVELTVRDFALIDRLALTFSPNFNVITGETGAGKSILIGALGSLLGMRTSSEMVRTGADRANVEAVFRIPSSHPARAMIEEIGGEFDADEVIVRREMTTDGRTRGWIGGASVPMKTIREVGDLVLDFHGQHDHQFLLNPSEHGQLLDAFAGNGSEREAVRETHAALQTLRRERRALVDRQEELAAKRELLEFERKELDEIDPEPGEYESLDAERKVLENVERLGELLSGLAHLLTEAEESVVTQLGAGRRWLSEAAEIDDALEELTGDYEQAEILCQDLSTRIADRLAELEADPGRLEFVMNRLASLRKLARRYGSMEDAIARRQELADAMDEEAGFEDRIAALDDRVADAHEAFSQAVRALSRTRDAAAEVMGREVTASLSSLGIERARIGVELGRREAGEIDPTTSDAVAFDGASFEAGPEGAEDAEFLFASNRGEPMKPLSRIASGGEISRVMLAMKSVLASHDPVLSMVFDEIDQGVSGRVADAVAQRMAELSRHRQIIAITHLPQIAAYADRHIEVTKRETAERTVTEASTLDEDGRVRAMAEILGGTARTQAAMEHARDMLEHARTVHGS